MLLNISCCILRALANGKSAAGLYTHLGNPPPNTQCLKFLLTLVSIPSPNQRGRGLVMRWGAGG